MRPFPHDQIESTLPNRFEIIARTIPDQPAIVEATQTVTYDELNRRANRLAHTIVSLCGMESEPVALLCTHGLSVLVGILAVLKSGKFYAALSTSLSVEKKAASLRLIRARLLITDTARASEAEAIADTNQVVLNLDSAGSGEEENIPFSIIREIPAALFYTSGSTGEPKGVMRGHRMILHQYRIEIIRDQINPKDRLSFIHDCAFAGSSPEIFRALLAGATVYPLSLHFAH